MAHAHAAIEIPTPPDWVWQLIGGFGSLPDWLPYITESELVEGGRVRRLTNADGGSIIERLVSFQADERRYSYIILQSPFPVGVYLSTLRVLESECGAASRVEWSGDFTPDGVSDREASQLFQRIYADGLKALATRFSLDDR